MKVKLEDNKIKIKSFDKYTKDSLLTKEKGTKSGYWFFRTDSTLSKQSRWLFKEGGGYGFFENQLSQDLVNEISSIKEAYAGELYKLFINNHVPKTCLVEDKESHKLYIGSKRIKDFVDLMEHDEPSISFEKSRRYGKQITSVIIVAVLLGESDLNKENLGFTKDVFIKIDHGESLSLNDLGIDFQGELGFSCDFLASTSDLDINYFSDENIREALIEISNTFKSKELQFNTIVSKYEGLLSKYRMQYGESTFYLIGREHSTIGTLLTKRIQSVDEHLSNEICPRLF